MKTSMNFLLTLCVMTSLTTAIIAQDKVTTKIKDTPKPSQDVLLNRKMTKFNPEIHGLHFVNTINWEFPVPYVNGPVLAGACGGMSYTMLDYYYNAIEIPKQNFRPYNGSSLASYIEQRQKKSILENLDKWTELINNPFGWRTNEYFNWGLQGTNGGRLQELKQSIDAGNPAMLGLFKAGGGGFIPHHQVIAIGYQLGRYKGDLGNYKEDLKIFICDPNFPNRTMTLVPDLKNNSYYYLEDKSCNWMTYFVDTKYSKSTPPAVHSSNLNKDGKVSEILLEFYTGAVDLRGGNDNVSATIYFKDGSLQKCDNLNHNARWIDNYAQTVPISLKRPVKATEIKSVVLKTSFGGGINGDNWNLNGFRIIAKNGDDGTELYAKSGKPLNRFDGNNTPFQALIP